MKSLSILIIFAISLFCLSCGGAGDNPDPSQQQIKLTVSPGPAGVRTLNLLGPLTNTFGEVTYFIFGSDDDFGEVGNVPLLSERMDETQIGPLDTGIQMKGVDLSPWNAYQYVYVRALGVVPNRAYKIDPGYIYEFTTN